MKRLVGKVAIVTGGAQGIGLAVVKRFSREGCSVVIADLNDYKGEEAAKLVSVETGNTVIYIHTDVSDTDSVNMMRRQVVDKFGGVDILVNNAGIPVFHEPLATTTEEWKKCFAVNLEGAWNCCQSILPTMLEKNYGVIINIASNHASVVMKNTFPYPVTKHGLLGLTRVLALEYADRGVTVNAISPGFIDTPIADWYFSRTQDPALARKKEEENKPVGRLGQPSEVASVAALLASDEARFMVGENIVIDGGVSIRMSG